MPEKLIEITLIPVGGTTKIIQVKKDSTISQALAAIGMNFDSDTEVRANGDLLEANHIVEDGEQFVIMKGGKIAGALIC